MKIDHAPLGFIKCGGLVISMIMFITFGVSCVGSRDKALEAKAPDGVLISLPEKGKKLLQSKGCIACHSSDGTRLVGPSFKGIFAKDEKMSNGKTVKIDEPYLRESILNPTANIVEGYPPSMPVYNGLVTEDEISSMIEYIKSLK